MSMYHYFYVYVLIVTELRECDKRTDGRTDEVSKTFNFNHFGVEP